MYGNDEFMQGIVDDIVIAIVSGCVYIATGVALNLLFPRRKSRVSYERIPASKQDVLTVHEHLDDLNSAVNAAIEQAAELVDRYSAREQMSDARES